MQLQFIKSLLGLSLLPLVFTQLNIYGYHNGRPDRVYSLGLYKTNCSGTDSDVVKYCKHNSSNGRYYLHITTIDANTVS